ncbi:LysR family transcriptional regulator [Vibrio chagasii]|nr:LysR family transcriptional regulator [Vibrio chagasii]
MSHKFDLNLLRIFSVVYQQGSVTKAAEHLKVRNLNVSLPE